MKYDVEPYDDGHFPERPAPRVGRQNRPLLVVLLSLLAWSMWYYAEPSPENAPASSSTCAASADKEFDWFKILPSETLEWVPCYETPYQCARLQVPLNYAKPRGQKAAVALIKYPSRYHLGHELYRGPILYNPGGPGGSGVEMVRGRGHNFSALIGDDFDHIGFDPRGIGHTTPILDTLPTDSERITWGLSLPLSVNNTPDAAGKLHGYAKILGELVEERQKQTAEHMSTAIVARDMLSITRAHGRDKLLYWGFSYGTVLGITFSAMFPEHVGRVIVDGVADTENYYSAAWDNNLRDTDKGLRMTAASCAASSACPLREKTGALVEARIQSILENLQTAPLAVRNGSRYGVADYSLARGLLFRALYKPAAQMPALFAALAAAERGDGAPLHALGGEALSEWRCACGAGEPRLAGPPDTTAAVACGDGDVLDEDLPAMRRHYAKMAEMSSFAEVWVVHSVCTGWKIRPVERFHGPFVGNTSHPVLLIGNTADPVTPLWAAKKMSKGFTDAVVLTQNSPGHCSLAAPSLCTAKYIRAYFREGTLPPPGTVCEVEGDVFPPDEQKEDDVSVLQEEDRRVRDVARELSAAFEVPHFGLM
ncbi:hypothetical protein AURDEDRAFT_103901 [Auricularia subglabra TFB-10046 SS5]|nr:hypothetical protein AURDEDRAFT_103901 [Auricularia subglabra TFB-10046 SS5]